VASAATAGIKMEHPQQEQEQLLQPDATTAATVAAPIKNRPKSTGTPAGTTNASDTAVATGADADATPAQQQDRRYTGAPGEIRCQATTTRGRACAYVAAVPAETTPPLRPKYCHLHADYERNPPPRRNKSVLIASTTSLWQQDNGRLIVVQRGGSDDHNEEDNINRTMTTTGKVLPSPGSSSSSSSSSSSMVDVGDGAMPQSTTSHPRNGVSSTPFPLLSMLSTDAWFNKRVIISTGPFTNRTGRVVRWGNGWVSVRVDPPDAAPAAEGDGDEGTTPSSCSPSATGAPMKHKKGGQQGGTIHNRRSFELFLHPDQDVLQRPVID
jgi:hypothetical protein